MRQIKCIGRRRIEVSSKEDNILLTILWREKSIACLQLEKEEAMELCKCILYERVKHIDAST